MEHGDSRPDIPAGTPTETFAVGRCMVCGERSELTLPQQLANKVNRWRFGDRDVHIQNALPELSADEREMILSGTHPVCWDEMWKEE